MPLSTFHPALQTWFNSTFKSPSPPQAAGWPLLREGRNTLICAPTGSGKTLTAFMACLDSLFRQAVAGTLTDEIQVVYVSPLKALSNDIQKNLREPLEGIYATAHQMGLIAPEIRVLVRTGDTLANERQAMMKRPPHILVTTPESLFILLTAAKSREKLRKVRTVIVDEIHALARDKRGAHLALTLARLDHICDRTPQRVGLSATQRPVELVANFLVGRSENRLRPANLPTENQAAASLFDDDRLKAEQHTERTCEIVDLGHLRRVELSIEIPSSPLEAVCSHETWEEVYERLTELIKTHRTTLIFVNTRRMCERLAQHLSKRIGEDKVTSHHGSLSRVQRLSAETRLKSGSLSALVATASLELGIDIGSVDLVCQIGVTNSIGTLLQRVGRSGHSLTGISRGKLFALTIDELATATALSGAIRRGTMDVLEIPDKPLDILAQQIVAESAAEDWNEDELYQLVSRAWNYRDLTRAEFDEVLEMLAEGYRGPRGRNAAMIHYDGVGKRVHGRRGARLAAITSGGAIPDTADYQVVQEPAGIVVGTLNEDFAVESTPGDIFQLGNTSWKILKIEPGRVRVEDAHGEPPSIPFWLGEAPGRSNELSLELTQLRKEIESRLPLAVPSPARDDGNDVSPEPAPDPFEAERKPETVATGSAAVDFSLASADAPHGRVPVAPEMPALGRPPVAHPAVDNDFTPIIQWLHDEYGIEPGAALQLCYYFAGTKKVLGVLPTTETLVLERFFDESGGMQLVLHAPFGRRVNWAWGLALRKRFCRGFNFELQAAASENAVLLSLGPQHSFPLADVFQFLHPKTVEELLIQAMLVAPLFQTRWRWDASRALALLRFSGGKKVPAPLMRMRADDLLAAIFPHAAACPENLEGDRDIPNHPLVREVIKDCLHEAMDIDGLVNVLRKIHAGELKLVARDTTEPSLLAHEILTAKPYSFLDDAPLEERRTQAVIMRRGLSREDAAGIGALNIGAIERVREEAWPDPRDSDELHDVLMRVGCLTEEETAPFAEFLGKLKNSGRVTSIPVPSPSRDEGNRLWLATERVPLFQSAYPGAAFTPDVVVPAKERAREWPAEKALGEIVRGRLDILGPVTLTRLCADLGLGKSEVEQALLLLERHGSAIRGHFTPGVSAAEIEWCDRGLLARIHRYTLEGLRREIEPVAAADYMRFLFSWQHLDAGNQLEGRHGVRDVIAQLEGFEIAAVAYERDVLPGRIKAYDRKWLDQLSLSGDVTWGRRFPPNPMRKKSRHGSNVRSAPIGLFLREDLDFWLALAPPIPPNDENLSGAAREVLALLQRKGAVFFRDLVRETRRLPAQVEDALAELVASGYVTGDGFTGLRALLRPSAKRGRFHRRRLRTTGPFQLKPVDGLHTEGSIQAAGRWSLFRGDGAAGLFSEISEEQLAEVVARQLLRRWGIVFHRVIWREPGLPAWRDILRVYRRMEARGELRGGRFVAGFSGEQYALPEAVEHLRAIRKRTPDGKMMAICGADPLNLVGIITPGERVASRASTRIIFRDGIPVAVKEAREIKILERDVPNAARQEIYAALMRRAI